MLSPRRRDSALLLSFGSGSRARHEIQVTPNSPRAAVPLAIQDSHLGNNIFDNSIHFGYS